MMRNERTNWVASFHSHFFSERKHCSFSFQVEAAGSKLNSLEPLTLAYWMEFDENLHQQFKKNVGPCPTLT